MRMRKMRNLEPRMEKCADLRIAEPALRKGAWRQLKPDCTALWVEVGCGKGKFTAETAPFSISQAGRISGVSPADIAAALLTLGSALYYVLPYRRLAGR